MWLWCFGCDPPPLCLRLYFTIKTRFGLWSWQNEVQSNKSGCERSGYNSRRGACWVFANQSKCRQWSNNQEWSESNETTSDQLTACNSEQKTEHIDTCVKDANRTLPGPNWCPFLRERCSPPIHNLPASPSCLDINNWYWKCNKSRMFLPVHSEFLYYSIDTQQMSWCRQMWLQTAPLS